MTAAQDLVPDNSHKKKILIGCGIGCAVVLLLMVIIATFGVFQLKKVWRIFRETSVEAAADLRNKGFLPYGGDYTDKGFKETMEMFGRQLTVDKPISTRFYCLGATLDINGECFSDVLFIGQTCNVNRQIKGKLCFLGTKNSTLTIASGVKIKKVYVSDEVQVINNGEISEGISRKIDEFYNFSGLWKIVEKKIQRDYNFFAAPEGATEKAPDRNQPARPADSSARREK